MADHEKDRHGVADLGEERAKRAADRIAERYRDRDTTRLEDFMTENREAEEGPVARALRQAIEDGPSLYRLEQLTGVAASQLSRFLRGERGLSLDTVDVLAPALGLQVEAPRWRSIDPRGRLPFDGQKVWLWIEIEARAIPALYRTEGRVSWVEAETGELLRGEWRSEARLWRPWSEADPPAPER